MSDTELTLRASADELVQSAEPRGRKLPQEVKRPQTPSGARGLNAEIIVPELTDVPLKERVSHINARCAALGKGNVILASIHANAAGNGTKWMNARGWSCYTSKGDTAADVLATCLCEAAAKYFKDLRIRADFSDGDPDFEESFYILRHTT